MPSPARATRGKRAPKLDFAVTAEMIADAVPQDSAHCMIADGLKAAMPEARSVSVDLATIRFTDPKNGRRYIYLTPIPAQAALLDFDQGRNPEPFTIRCYAAQIVEPREKPAAAKSPANSGQNLAVVIGRLGSSGVVWGRHESSSVVSTVGGDGVRTGSCRSWKANL